MSIKLGTGDINKIYLGSTEIKKAYLGSTLIYDKTGGGGFTPSANTLIYYKLDGDALDSSGNGYNGTPTNISFVPGQINQAASFNGSNSSIDIGKPINNLTSGTLSMWVKIASASGAYELLGFRHSTTSTVRDGQFDFNNGIARFIVYNGSGYFVLSAGSAITNVGWNHIAFTWNTTTKSIYINGTLSNSSADSSSVFNSAIDVNYNLGKILIGSPTWYSGLMDEVIIENVCRSSTEITNYFNTQNW